LLRFFIGKQVGYLFHWDIGSYRFGFWDAEFAYRNGGFLEKGAANEDSFAPISSLLPCRSTGTSQRDETGSLLAAILGERRLLSRRKRDLLTRLSIIRL
jgi:hypothetical protein